ncbi:alpha-2-macroglobulin [Hyphomicrobium sp.]|uniref:alpha-2-macroglobulin family protein n=1 Tax=Hyphomicrobium sp. TaxID=82 RepID=UPI000FB3802E|nr:alpha-2-macroglobulin [Hyphomicrobium sp.]RUO98415.1 MAG: alpha-2-macroglobulin family protein [Hyphomicrobium sp.]
MLFLARLAAVFTLMLATFATASADPKPFLHQGVAADAKRYEAYLKANWKPDGKSPAALKAQAEKDFASDPRAASRALANVVSANAQDSAAWTRLAEALIAIPPDPNNSNERYDLAIYASGAAYTGYQRATGNAEKAHALYVLGRTLEARSYWRPAIDALSLSLSIADDQTTREMYDRLRGQYGFRMTDYKTDNDATPPRLCLQFSEDLSRTQTDVAKFISVGGKDPQNLVQDGKQLCLEGLKYGERYQVQIRAGLPSDIGEKLLKTSDIAVYIPDRSPFVRFGGKAYVLPSRGQQGIPVTTTNTSKIDVEVYRIGDRNLATTLQSGDMARQLSSYDVDNIRDRSGIKVYQGQMDIASKLNEDVTTAVPVTDATGKLEPGVYVIVAKPSEKQKQESYERATQWFIVSDLGLTAFSGNDGVHAFVRSLSDATGIGGSSVKLIAKNNEVLATATTDGRGYAKFDAAITKGEGGAAPAILVAQKGEGEYAFLDLTLNSFDLSDRGVQGRDPSGPVDAYIYTERGVYRGGEDVNVTALVRDQFGKASAIPATLMLFRPDGVEQARLLMNDAGLGGRSRILTLAKTAMTGTWRVKLYTDPKAEPIAERSFLVEDFVPERLDMTLTSDLKALSPDENQSINADGRYLYGPPAAGLGLEGEVVVRASNKDVPGYAGYVFGQADELVNPARQALQANLAMDQSGKAAVPITLPQMPKTPKPLEAQITVKLREDGGRTIERNLTLPVDLKLQRIGIKPLFDNLSAPEGQNAEFNVVLLGADGKAQAASDLTWTLTRLDTNWQWYRRDGAWTYEAVTVKRKIGSGELAVTAGGAAKISQPIDWGRYRLDIASSAADGPASSIIFNAGWYTAGDNVDSPEQLDVALDKDSYKSGDTAKLRIASKLGGKALVAVLGTGLDLMKEVDIAKGGGEVEIPVDGEWGPGAYATAILYRPMDEGQKRMPSRAIGIRWLPIDQSSKHLKVAVTLPDKVKSGAHVDVPLKVEGLAPGEDARVVVAAVDLGILNLTRFETPAPEKWFSQQQKLAFEIRDFYGKLIDGMHADRGKLRSGGDAGAALQGNPTVETVVSLYSGIVQVKDDGTASVSFDLPDFNGTVRFMAVAWSKDKVGHGSGDLIVRDAVALTVAVPRFMTLGDEVDLGFGIHNVDGPAAPYKLTLSRKAGDDRNETLTPVADKTADLKQGERTMQRILFKPTELGEVTLKAVVTGPNDIAVKREMTFNVFPPAGDIKRTTISSLKPGGKLSVSADLAYDLIPSRTRINMSVGPAARLDVPTLLSQLDRYPYGCAEQTVSRAMPLVVANAVAAQIGLAQDKELKDRVQKAIGRVFEMQDSTGAFGVWGPYSTDLWLTAYVTDFLTRAKEANYDVPRESFNRALDRLQNFIAYASDFEKGGEDRAYALYVLARNGRAPIGDLRYYADERIGRFSTPLAKAQVGAALAMMGDKERAERTFAAALAAMPDTPDSGYRSDYGSTLRDGAALVTLAAETGIAREDQPRLATVIAKAYETRTYTSTQEQAWMLLAAKALNDEVKATTLSIDGKPVNGPLLKGLTPAELKNGALTITNNGDTAVDAVISVIGAALTPEPAVSKGFKIERQAYTVDGKKIDLASLTGGKAKVKQNDRFVMVVKVTSEDPAGRVMVVDRLPAGFEIENPHLVDSGAISGLSWLKSTAEPEHTEFRDDRFVAAFNFANVRTSTSSSSSDAENSDTPDNTSGNSTPESQVVLPDGTTQPKTTAVTATLAYIVRAVTPGTFVHPAATVEDMYRPERYARSAAGTLAVSTKE